MLKDQYRDYLIERGYKETTPSGKPSTVYDYVKRIDFVCECENATWEYLADNIDEIEQRYEPGGSKSALGAKSHNAVVNSLCRFREFCSEGQVESENNQEENHSFEYQDEEDSLSGLRLDKGTSFDKKMPFGFYRTFFGAFLCWVPFFGLLLSIDGYVATKNTPKEELTSTRGCLSISSIIIAFIPILITVIILFAPYRRC